LIPTDQAFKLFAKESFLFFNKYVRGRQIGQHNIEWDGILNLYDRVLIECARGHGKTDDMSIGRSLWRAYRGEPWDRLIVSYSEEQAIDIMRKIEQEVLNNPLLAHLRPGSSTTWQSTLFTFPGGVRIKAVGFGTSVRGQHPNEIQVDDPLKDQGALDPEAQYEYYMGALMGTAIKNTRVCVIGTPLNPGDLLSRLETNPVYHFRQYPALENGEPLFPYLFDKRSLDQKKLEVGSLVFSREYLLQRIDPETQVFKDPYLTINSEIQFPEFIAVRTFIDPAISEKEAACDTAVTTWGIDERNNFWELDTRMLHSDDVSSMLKEVMKCAELFRFKADYAVVFEAELFQRLMAFEFRRLCNDRGIDVRVIEVTHTGNLGKHQRIQGLQPVWEARAIHLLPESDLTKQFREYRPRAKNIRLDGIDALSWIKDERVCVPFLRSQPVVGAVPDEVREV
jgi:hypothetical protein